MPLVMRGVQTVAPSRNVTDLVLNDAPLEDQLLGGLLHVAENPDQHTKDLIDRIGTSRFRIPANRIIHTALRELLRTVGSADLVSISEHLMSNEQLWEAGGYSRLAYLWSWGCPPEGLPALVMLAVGEQ
jgi:replicative DNA helicase